LRSKAIFVTNAQRAKGVRHGGGEHEDGFEHRRSR
jgi:hypothetical protein